MGRRKKKRRPVGADGEAEAPALSGIALLLSEMPVDTLDLHGLNGDQARARLADFLRTRAALSPGRVVHVITGRGNRSEGMPVLPGVVREALAGSLSEYALEQAGLPGGGGVAIRTR